MDIYKLLFTGKMRGKCFPQSVSCASKKPTIKKREMAWKMYANVSAIKQREKSPDITLYLLKYIRHKRAMIRVVPCMSWLLLAFSADSKGKKFRRGWKGNTHFNAASAEFLLCSFLFICFHLLFGETKHIQSRVSVTLPSLPIFRSHGEFFDTSVK